MTAAPVAAVPAYDLAPLLPVLLIGALLALAAVAWRWRRERGSGVGARLRALTALTLFLTFDLILFGAYTRLTDSGLGCPDWPGCYGTASPIGAAAPIEAAQSALPTGPVSHGKAWIEMIHRYLATAVGAMILLLTALSWWQARRARRRVGAGFVDDDPADSDPGGPSADPSPWWSTATLAWVCLQGAFGAWTVTLKLYPAVVTAHLLGGFGLAVLLALQHDRQRRRPLPTTMSRGLFVATLAVAALAVLQAALGGWVSTNYAVLACRDLPTCQGSFWPPMDFANGFTLRRGLGLTAAGDYLSFAALTAIHVGHRIGAGVLFVAVSLLVWRLRATRDPALARWSLAIGATVAWQLLTGLGNVVLGWPVAAALAHTGGAAVLITLLAVLAARVQVRSRTQAQVPMPVQVNVRRGETAAAQPAMALRPSRRPDGRLHGAP